MELNRAASSWNPSIWQGRVNFPLCLAPMVGLSHAALRMVVREYLPAGATTFWPTEMLNSRKLPFQTLGETPETAKGQGETGLVPQILGNEEEPIAESVRKLADWGAVGIDINMGCPVKKALRHNYGVALMGDRHYAADVVAMTVKNTSLPVSVKLRAQSSGEFGDLLVFVQGLREAGASWITLHPRTAEQKRRGTADWSQIRRLKKSVDFPVVGNGDIQTDEDVLAMLDETGCDLVMAGRALAARPWMMWQLGERFGWPPPSGREGPAPRGALEEGREYGHALNRLIEYSREFFSEEAALRRVRFHIRTTCMWMAFGHQLIGIGTKAQTLDELSASLAEFFAFPQEMTARTDLRE